MLQDIERYPDKSSWATHVRNILEIYGFSDVWTNQGVANVNCFLNVFKQRVRDCYIQNWNEQINISTRANTYKLFADFNFQFYLDTITIQKYRIALTKLRVSSHRHEIEVGRWHKPQPLDVSDRKCILCNKLEDEYHFLLECPLYDNLRSTYIKPYFWKRINTFKFAQLLSSTNSTTIKNLSTYICKAFNQRSICLQAM